MKRQLKRSTRPRVMLPRTLVVTKRKESAKRYKRDNRPSINFNWD